MLWLELPLSRTNFHSPKGVRAIEVRLYMPFPLYNDHPLYNKEQDIQAELHFIRNLFNKTFTIWATI